MRPPRSLELAFAQTKPVLVDLRLVGVISYYSGSRLICTQTGMAKPAEDVLRGDLP
jgi:hypothetical protein